MVARGPSRRQPRLGTLDRVPVSEGTYAPAWERTTIASMGSAPSRGLLPVPIALAIWFSSLLCGAVLAGSVSRNWDRYCTEYSGQFCGLAPALAIVAFLVASTSAVAWSAEAVVSRRPWRAIAVLWGGPPVVAVAASLLAAAGLGELLRGLGQVGVWGPIGLWALVMALSPVAMVVAFFRERRQSPVDSGASRAARRSNRLAALVLAAVSTVVIGGCITWLTAPGPLETGSGQIHSSFGELRLSAGADSLFGGGATEFDGHQLPEPPPGEKWIVVAVSTTGGGGATQTTVVKADFSLEDTDGGRYPAFALVAAGPARADPTSFEIRIERRPPDWFLTEAEDLPVSGYVVFLLPVDRTPDRVYFLATPSDGIDRNGNLD